MEDPQSETEQTNTTGPSQSDHLFHDRSDDLEPGKVVDGYEIESMIGRGGCSTVYAVRHSECGEEAALKVLKYARTGVPGNIERFKREVHAVELIGHRNIVDMFGAGKLEDGRPYCIMELVRGDTLSRLVRQHGPLMPAQALAFIEPICDALEAVHAAGIIHRDIKPSNVLVSGRDAKLVKLIDFGIAKLSLEEGENPLTAVGQRLGTPVAMSPEQLRCAEVDTRTDIYAVGVLLHFLVTGQYQFYSSNRREIEQLHLHSEPPPASARAPVSPAIDAIIARCLSKQPEDRFDTVGDVVHAWKHASVARSDPGQRRTETALAMAVYVEAVAADEEDDETLEDQAAVLDTAEATLTEAGFATVLHTGSTLLCARVLSNDDKGGQRARAKKNLLVRALEDELNATLEEPHRLRVRVLAHVDSAVVRRDEIIGGPVANMNWVPAERAQR